MHLLEQLKCHKIRTLKTLVTCLGHGCIGLQGGIIGPALIDLKILVSCNFDQISHMVTGRFAGYAIGSIIAGLIAPRTNPQLVLSITLFVAALFHITMPLTYSLTAILTMITLTGIANGITDTTSNMFIIKLWAKECPPFLQALHFMFGLGSLIAPIIVEPWLKEAEIDDSVDGQSINNSSSTVKQSISPSDIEIKYPYFIVSIVTGLVSILYLCLYVRHRDTSDHPSRTVTANVEMVGHGGRKMNRSINPTVQKVIVSLTFCFTFIYVGLETSVGTFIPAYAYKGPLKVSKSTGALMSSAYWLAFTCFRLVAVVLSSLIGSTWILVLNLSNSIIGSVLMLVSRTNVPLFWFACTYVGIGMSSTWGSLFGFMESNFPMTPAIVTVFNVGACFGCSVIPALVGHFVDIDTNIFTYLTLGFTIIVAVIFLIIFVICKLFLFNFEPIKDHELELKPQLDRQLSQVVASGLAAVRSPSFSNVIRRTISITNN